MEPWQVIAEEEKSIAGISCRLVVLKGPGPKEGYRTYILEHQDGHWELTDRFYLPGSDEPVTPDGILKEAWVMFLASGARPPQENW